MWAGDYSCPDAALVLGMGRQETLEMQGPKHKRYCSVLDWTVQHTCASCQLLDWRAVPLQTRRDDVGAAPLRAMSEDRPTILEILELTRQELTVGQNNDPIQECGRAALAVLTSDPELCSTLAYQKLHDVPYRKVKTCWRRLYTDASLWRVVHLVEGCEGQEQDGVPNIDNAKMDQIVRLLDMALILTGAPGREAMMELWFAAIGQMLSDHGLVSSGSDDCESSRPVKRRKIEEGDPSTRKMPSLPSRMPEVQPGLRNPLPRDAGLTLSAFQKKLNDVEAHTPLIMEKAIEHWPAMGERPWSDAGYLLEQTLGGRRLVPVEIGKSYTDSGWGQRILAFRDFMNEYMLPRQEQAKAGDGKDYDSDISCQTAPSHRRQTGYLAQHDLFAQIPSLRSDISIPDYCYCEPAPSPHLAHIKPTPKLEEPLLNAWFGPAGTVSPLHTDPYHNILAQVVGYKYIRLYPPHETEKLYPRSVDEAGVDMSNTSQVDLDVAMAAHPEISCWAGPSREPIDPDIPQDFEDEFPLFKDAQYVEGLLAPGDCLYLPVGWWHYVRSLTPSFSVSFWFN